MALCQEDRKLIRMLRDERQKLKEERHKNLQRNMEINRQLKSLSYTSIAEKFNCSTHVIKWIEFEIY